MSTAIRQVRARRIWDSRGRPTIEAEVELADGTTGRGVAPAGASRGRREAVDLRDGGPRFGGLDVGRALHGISAEIGPALAGCDGLDQAAIDARMSALDGTANAGRLGGNALIAVSLAALAAAAAAQRLPLWQWLVQGPWPGLAPDRSAAARRPLLPLPEVQIFGGGVHAGQRTDIQDFMVMPVGAGDIGTALGMVAEVYRAAGELMAARGARHGVADEGGWWPAFASNEAGLDLLAQAIERAGYRHGEVVMSLDIAASEFCRDGVYRLALDGRALDREAWRAVLDGWMRRYPIVAIEDPFDQDDDAGMVAFTAAHRATTAVVGDDYLVTSAARVEAAAASGACNAVLIKPNQAGTVSAALAALAAARRAGFLPIVSARSGETEDVAIAHIAVGTAAGVLKVGSFARSERMAKWNELLRIADALGPDAAFAGGAVLPGRGAVPSGGGAVLPGGSAPR